ncbi:hypothetical protein COOONC_20914, partial [Cooperia oncophora]
MCGNRSKDISGEFLEGLTDQEWEEGSAAKPAELLNIEKQKNSVSVFVGPKELVERSERPMRQKSVKEEPGDPIVQLVNRVANMVTAGREDAQAEVSNFEVSHPHIEVFNIQWRVERELSM